MDQLLLDRHKIKGVNRLLPFQKVSNFRDMGGYLSQDGRRVKYGYLYRSAALENMSLSDQLLFQQLKISHIVDYRSAEETELIVHINPTSAQRKRISAYQGPVNWDQDHLNDRYFRQTGHQAMLAYYHYLGFDSAAYRHMVNLMMEDETVRFVQHCAYGKDRTGVGAAITLMILGIDEETILEDYLLSNAFIGALQAAEEADLEDKLEVWALHQHRETMIVKDAYLTVFFNKIKHVYGSVESYLLAEFGLTQKKIASIRERYLIAAEKM